MDEPSRGHRMSSSSSFEFVGAPLDSPTGGLSLSQQQQQQQSKQQQQRPQSQSQRSSKHRPSLDRTRPNRPHGIHQRQTSLSSSQQQQQPQPQIRHSGRAHVRGKIRRVWRPRFLELWDNGLIRYYELPPTADLLTQSTDACHINMIPKYTLAIYHARILDVTTFRDMHVGLPASCYGFVFRGQRLIHLENDDDFAATETTHASTSTTTTTTTTATTNHHAQWMTPPSSANNHLQVSQSSPSSISATSTTNHGPLYGCVGMVPGVGSGAGGFYSSGGGDHHHHPTPVKEQRDFLCAVATLEEAQMWVVALQWAAGQYRVPAQLFSIEPWWNRDGTTPKLPQQQQQLSQSMRSYRTPIHSIESRRQHSFSPLEATASSPMIPPLTIGTSASSITNTHAPIPVNNNNNSTAMNRMKRSNLIQSPETTSDAILIPSTKDWQSPLPPLPPSPLLVSTSSRRHDQSTSSSATHNAAVSAHHGEMVDGDDSNRRGHGDSGRQQHPINLTTTTTTTTTTSLLKPSSSQKIVVTKVVQYCLVRWELAFEIHVLLWASSTNTAKQWKMYRTSQDVQTLIREMSQELGPAVVDQALGGQKPRRALQRLPKLRQPISSSSSSKTYWDHSLALVNNTLRNLAMDAILINSLAFKRFLGLAHNPRHSNWYARWFHTGRSIITGGGQVSLAPAMSSPPTNASTNTTTTTNAANPESYVKDWLRTVHHTAQSTYWERCILQWAQTATQQFQLLPRSSWWWCYCLAPAVPWGLAQYSRSIPSISLRVDVLVASWVGAAYLGSSWWWWRRNRPPHPSTRSHLERQQKQQPSSKSTNRSKEISTTAVSSRDGRVSTIEDDVVDPDDDCDYLEHPVHTFLQDDSIHTDESDGEDMSLLTESQPLLTQTKYLSSPIPQYPGCHGGHSCWSEPATKIFYVRGASYLRDKVKIPSGTAPLTCRGVDVWMTDSPERHIARHPAVLGGQVADEDTFLVNFLLPFGNLVAYFRIPPPAAFPPKLYGVWENFLRGDQEYRDARLKLLPIVMEGPWIVKAAVGPGKSPALLGKVIPLQYFFRDPTDTRKGVYEVDVIITASTIAKGILSVVKGHTQSVSIAFAFIIEGTNSDELPETVLCCFQLHTLHLELCPILPPYQLEDEAVSD